MHNAIDISFRSEYNEGLHSETETMFMNVDIVPVFEYSNGGGA